MKKRCDVRSCFGGGFVAEGARFKFRENYKICVSVRDF